MKGLEPTWEAESRLRSLEALRVNNLYGWPQRAIIGPLNWTAFFFSILQPSFTHYMTEAVLLGGSGCTVDGGSGSSQMLSATFHMFGKPYITTVRLTDAQHYFCNSAMSTGESSDMPLNRLRFSRTETFVLQYRLSLHWPSVGESTFTRSQCESSVRCFVCSRRLARDWNVGEKIKEEDALTLFSPQARWLPVDKHDLTRVECSCHEVNVLIAVRLFKCQNEGEEGEPESFCYICYIRGQSLGRLFGEKSLHTPCTSCLPSAVAFASLEFFIGASRSPKVPPWHDKELQMLFYLCVRLPREALTVLEVFTCSWQISELHCPLHYIWVFTQKKGKSFSFFGHLI